MLSAMHTANNMYQTIFSFLTLPFKEMTIGKLIEVWEWTNAMYGNF